MIQLPMCPGSQATTEDLSRHSLFGTDLCESPLHASLSAYPSPPSVPGLGAGYEEGVDLCPLDLPSGWWVVLPGDEVCGRASGMMSGPEWPTILC